jgi:hypothetical protein
MICLIATSIAKLVCHFRPEPSNFLNAVQLERSKTRPLASGAVTMTEAAILLTVLVGAIFYMFSTAGPTA